MKRRVLMLALMLAVGISLVMIGNHAPIAQQTPLKVTDVFKADIAGMEGKEVLVQLVEFAPRGASGKHYHPGHETPYVLEGSLIVEMEGHSPMTLKMGESAYVPAKHVHEGKNASTTDPLKVLVFRIHEKGQPVTVRQTEPYFWQ